jgi:hypothetical protein
MNAYICFCVYLKCNYLCIYWNNRTLQRELDVRSEPHALCLVYFSMLFFLNWDIRRIFTSCLHFHICTMTVIFWSHSQPGLNVCMLFDCMCMSSPSLTQVIRIMLYSRGFTGQKSTIQYISVIFIIYMY